MLARQNTIQPQIGLNEKIHDNITQTIGNTPLVRLSRMIENTELECDLVAKVEYFNPAGSVKDRPALAMIDALMASDEFTSDTHIIEATSGNNGVACAWICAIRQIPLTIVIPEHMSIERRKLIRLYGANVITTPKALGTKGAIDHAALLVSQQPNAVSLNQFSNLANVDTHFNSTAQEIWRDCDGNLDIFVAGVGTGGTITGIAKALKQLNPSIQIVAVEPSACPVLSEGKSGVHKIQGLSSGHVPDILDVSVIDSIETVSDDDAVEYARMLARIEGIPVGISSGAALCASMRLATSAENKGKRIVTLFADTAERYFSTDLFSHCQ
ncbi:cysteine synthase A [Aliiglaciecola sp. 3_MG-2023]|uniref:cysteine synthase A n=1 Tax=Aliiglaciecola sp. 3_MG-2023 TaxID=3062644 RepID=UPI0026E384BD|nr:cysteine synthase A [Aliiglaciecola sp. 3_MG-2023]MDO6692782.1 cysteine synthase A [Aliiglaciecola sp. 3_MG-2023]